MTFQSTRSFQFIRSFKLSAALSILTLGAMITPAAFAGEAFVNNTHRNTYGYSETDLNIDSESYSNGQRQYAAYADKIYIDGAIDIESPERRGPRQLQSEVQQPSFAPPVQNVAFDKFTVHTASSHDFGSEEFGSETTVAGTIFSREDFDETSHTTSAGVR
ncbi:MAG: hypothetical protein WA902_21670 [Thermosynechococcaceae cyanobacterium]